jgi:hypothetical protein
MNEWDLLSMVMIGAAAAGLAMAWRYNQWQRRVRRVEGVVVDQVEAGGSSIGTFYYAVVEFIDAGGQRIRFTDRFGQGGHPQFPVGSAVSVDYALSDPAEAQIHSSAIARLIAVGAVVVGTLLMVVGLWPQ